MASRGVIKSKVKSTVSLNDRQKQFCVEYIIDLNGLQAYKRAYGEDKTDGTCKVEACKLLTKPNIKKYINDLVDSYTDDIDVTIGAIVSNIKSIALNPKSRDSDRIKASQLLAQYKGMLIEHKDITSNGSSIVVTLED